MLDFEEGTPDQSFSFIGAASDWSIRFALPQRRFGVAANPKVRPQFEVGFVEAGELVLEKIRFKIFGMRNVFSKGSHRFSRWS